MSFNLVNMDGVFILLEVVYDGFYEFRMFMPFHALGVEDAISCGHSTPALSVAIWVCSYIKAAEIPASLAMFMAVLLVSLVSPMFALIAVFLGSLLVEPTYF
jgi:hypothetical protein